LFDVLVEGEINLTHTLKGVIHSPLAHQRLDENQLDADKRRQTQILLFFPRSSAFIRVPFSKEFE
jgi:hypothetical protein